LVGEEVRELTFKKLSRCDDLYVNELDQIQEMTVAADQIFCIGAEGARQKHIVAWVAGQH
jgi:hypothetical protein